MPPENPAPQPNESVPPLTPRPETPQPPKARLHHKLLANKKLVVLATLLAVALVAVLYILVIHKKPAAQPANATAKTSKSSAVSPAGTTYLDKASKIAKDLGFFKDMSVFGQNCDTNGQNCTNEYQPSDISYYKVGTTADGSEIIVALVHADIQTQALFALGDNAGHYKLLDKLNDDSDFGGYLAAGVTEDKTDTLGGVDFPTSVTVNGQKLTGTYTSLKDVNFMANGLLSIQGSFFGDLTNLQGVKKLSTQNGITYYEVVASDANGSIYQKASVYGVYHNLFSLAYLPAGEIDAAGSNPLKVSWSAGDNNSSVYFSAGPGCGFGGYVIAQNINSTDLTGVGKTGGGETVYQLPSSSPLVQYLYNDDYQTGTGDDASLDNLTLQQFSDQHAYFLAQNAFGEYVVYQREDMFSRGGCGKPSIYLYPTHTESVSVKVGAEVVKSSPSYGAEGWQGVTAQPDGTLSYGGAYYPYLYWEGYGYGIYPPINSGTIVKTVDAPAVVKQQLTEQGLKPKEINDFMAYWGPRLKSTKPYIRLSWLGTAVMNELAPLNISPAPDNVIRVFLDYQPLDSPYNLPAQKLAAPKRQGFTVVEWGGLLRNGLN